MVLLIKTLINLYRKTIFSVQEAFRKISLERVIYKYDNEAKLEWIPSGFALFPSSFSPSIEGFGIAYDKYGNFQTRDIPLALAELARDQILRHKNLISEYFSLPVRLDDMYIGCINPSVAKKKGFSEGWHHDHCGHRLKLWMCLRGDGSSPTLYIPNSHKRRVQMNLTQLARIFGLADYSSKENAVSIGLSTGDVGIFDTNGSHRGGFDENSSERICLVVEFITVDKCNLISKYAPCGPGGSAIGRLTFSRDVKEVLQETGFLDENLLIHSNDGFSYSISNF